jgi:hypothetical protein
VTRNGERAEPAAEAAFTEGLLAARFSAGGQYPDGCPALSRLDLTACKSWVSISHVLSEPRPGDVLAFHLPFAIVSPRVTCDFGVGGGLYGKLDAEGTPEIVWSTEFEPEHPVRWSLITAGRTDYEGEESGPDAYRSKCWFHLIDRNKSLAVAVTGIPADCAVVTASLRADGNCVIAFRLGSPITGPAQFGACYHFLYDIPPVSAATNPQSILLPPQVEAQLRF